MPGFDVCLKDLAFPCPFVLDFRTHGQNVGRSSRSALEPYQTEAIIELIQRAFLAVLSVERLLFISNNLRKTLLSESLEPLAETIVNSFVEGAQ